MGYLTLSTDLGRRGLGDLDHLVEFLEMVKDHEIDGKAVVYPHRRTEEIVAVPSWTAQDEQAYLDRGGS